MIGKILAFISGFVLGTFFGTAFGKWLFEELVDLIQKYLGAI